MKQKITLGLLLGYFLTCSMQISADIFELFAPVEQKVVIVGEIQKREHTLDSLKQEKEKLLAEEAAAKNQQELNKTNDLILNYKQKLSHAHDSAKDYYNTVLGVLGEMTQLLLDLQLLRQKNIQTVDAHIVVLENFLNDPNFKSVKTEVSAVYTFEDLQKLYQEVLLIKEKIKQQKDQLEVLKTEQEEAKQEALLVIKELKERERERTSFNDGDRSASGDDNGWGVAEEAKLLDIEIKMLLVKKEWAEATVKEVAYQISMLTSRLEISISQQEAAERDLDRIDRSLRVSEVEVLGAQEQLATKKVHVANIQAQYSQEIRHLSHNKQLLKEQFEKAVEQSKVDFRNSKELDEWSFDLTKYDSEFTAYNLGYLNEKIRVIDGQSEIFEANKILEKVRLIFDEVVVKVIASWHKISQRNLRSDEDIENEKSRYLNNKLEAQRIISSYRDKQELVSKNINNLSRALINLESAIKDVKKNSQVILNKHGGEGCRQILSILEHSIKLLNIRIDLNRKLSDIYTAVIGVERDILRHIEMVEERLSKIGIILQRSRHAISWENIKNIIPNLGIFVFGLKTLLGAYVNDFSFAGILFFCRTWWRDHWLFFISLSFCLVGF